MRPLKSAHTCSPQVYVLLFWPIAEINRNIFPNDSHSSIFTPGQESFSVIKDIACSSIVEHFDCPFFLGDYKVYSVAITGFFMFRFDEKVGNDTSKAMV